MANPQFIEENPLALVDVKDIFVKIDKRDKELNFLSNKCKEHLDGFVEISTSKKEEIHKKLVDLNLTRIKEEHIAKIIDFLPRNADELKVVLQGFNLTLPKKDQDEILKVV